jgi:Flp pilus assembly protein TadD
MVRTRAAALLGGLLGLAAYAAVALVASVTASPLSAETAGELESASRATDDTATGLSLARNQIESGELLEALATLERIMMNDPEDLEARALHAGLLCRIDDRRGAIMEFDLLRGLDVPQDVSDEARQPCRGGR